MSDETHIPDKKKKSYKNFLFIGLVFVAFILLNRHEPVNTIDCTPEIIKTEPDVVTLGAWWCTYCYQAKKYFQKNKIHYCEYDMESTETGKQLYEENGGGAVPLLLIGQYRIQGFNLPLIEEALIRTEQKNQTQN